MATTTLNGSPSADGTKPRRLYSASEVNALKERDNWTNLRHIAGVYLVLALTLTATIWSYRAVAGMGLGWWWNIPASCVAITIIGAVQHQLGGIIHEGTHYILFANRRMSEAVSDWFAAFPIYTSTQAFRLHHLSHHQFVNDPQRDANFAQAKDSGHWLDFPLTHMEITWAIIKQMNPVRLVSYIVARLRYSVLGVESNPYADAGRPGSAWTNRVAILFAAGVPAVQVPLVLAEMWGLAALSLLLAWMATVTYYASVREVNFTDSRIDPVISHRTTFFARVTFQSIVYGGLTAACFATGHWAWAYYGVLWILPLFTSFPLFMILREWIQHGNADRGRYTNTRIFLVGPLVRYAVFPFGMEYHLPHHLFASVPHYKLKDLHELMLRDPEYREKGTIVEGWSKPGVNGHPTIIDVLGPAFAQGGEHVHVDETTLELAEINNTDAIARQVAASRGQLSAPMPQNKAA
jgi:fatty acid desaturase